MPRDVDLAAYGLLDIPISDKSAIDFLDKIAQARDARIEQLEFAIALADDRLNKRGDPIACHIYLVNALAGHKLSDALQNEARALLAAAASRP